MSTPPAAAPTQVIPNFGPYCPRGTVCWSWLSDNWNSRLAPALVEHIYITAIAVGIGLVISLAAALYGTSNGWFDRGFRSLATLLYTIPAAAFFLLMVPIVGLNLLTVEIGLVGYTLLLLFGNAAAGLRSVPPEVTAAATGMGMTRRQILFKVNLPLALPSIMTGIRVAVVTAISLATVAAYVVRIGLGGLIFDGLREGITSAVVITGLLAVVLALVADALVVLLQRAITPWARARR